MMIGGYPRFRTPRMIGGTPMTSETSICAMVKALVYWGIIPPSLGLPCKGYVNTNWLVVYLPLWKIWKSVGIITFPIYGKTIQMFQTTNQQINLDAPKFLVENNNKKKSSKLLQTPAPYPRNWLPSKSSLRTSACRERHSYHPKGKVLHQLVKIPNPRNLEKSQE